MPDDGLQEYFQQAKDRAQQEARTAWRHKQRERIYAAVWCGVAGGVAGGAVLHALSWRTAWDQLQIVALVITVALGAVCLTLAAVLAGQARRDEP